MNKRTSGERITLVVALEQRCMANWRGERWAKFDRVYLGRGHRRSPPE